MRLKKMCAMIGTIFSFCVLFCSNGTVLASPKASNNQDGSELNAEIELLSEVYSTSCGSSDQDDRTQEEFISIWCGNKVSPKARAVMKSLRSSYPGINDPSNYKKIAKTPEGIEALRKYVIFSDRKRNKLVALNILYPGIVSEDYDYRKMAESPEGREVLLAYAEATSKRFQALKALEALFPEISSGEGYAEIAKTLEGMQAIRIYINITDSYRCQLKAFEALMIAEQEMESQSGSSNLRKIKSLLPPYYAAETFAGLSIEDQFKRISGTQKGNEALIAIAKLSESVELKLNAIKSLIPGIDGSPGSGSLIDYRRVAETQIGAEALCIYITIEDRPQCKRNLIRIVDALFPQLKDARQYAKMVKPNFAPQSLCPSVCRYTLNIYNTIKNEIERFGRLYSIIEYDEIYRAYKFCQTYLSDL